MTDHTFIQGIAEELKIAILAASIPPVPDWFKMDERAPSLPSWEFIPAGPLRDEVRKVIHEEIEDPFTEDGKEWMESYRVAAQKQDEYLRDLPRRRFWAWQEHYLREIYAIARKLER